jgi:hypothetical protein
LRPAGLVRTIRTLSFRNDHEAAISRIAALEHELAAAQDQAREKSQRDRERIAMLEREIADLRRVEPSAPRRARTPSAPPAPAAVPIDELATKGPPISIGFLFALLVVAFGVIVFALLVLT